MRIRQKSCVGLTWSMATSGGGAGSLFRRNQIRLTLNTEANTNIQSAKRLNRNQTTVGPARRHSTRTKHKQFLDPVGSGVMLAVLPTSTFSIDDVLSEENCGWNSA